MARIQLRFDDTSHEVVEVEVLAEGRFRLLDTPLLSTVPVYQGDVIVARGEPDGTHRFAGVVERADMRHYAWVVPRGWTDSADWPRYQAAIEQAGGRWEQAFGGVIHVHVPKASPFDPEAELDRYLSSDWREV